jgi:TRIAP1/MDM35 family protein
MSSSGSTSTNSNSNHKSDSKAAAPLKEMVSEQCGLQKKVYTDCFNRWYTGKFLKGNFTPECEDEFLAYKDCMVEWLESRGMRKTVDEEKNKMQPPSS